MRKAFDSNKNVLIAYNYRRQYTHAVFRYRYLHYLLFFSTLSSAIPSKVQ